MIKQYSCVGILMYLSFLSACYGSPDDSPAPAGATALPASFEHKIASETLRSMFHTLDCTDEGHLETGEIAEHMSQIFRPFDADRSMSLSRPEFARARRTGSPELMDAAFRMSDTNGNGEVDNFEFRGFIERLMVVADADKDGEVTPGELGFSEPARR